MDSCGLCYLCLLSGPQCHVGCWQLVVHAVNSLLTHLVLAVYILQLLENVLAPVCKGPGGYDESAWPVVAPRGKPGVWGNAEDDLLWLGIIRWVGRQALGSNASIQVQLQYI